jgi:hypothetical protein
MSFNLGEDLLDRIKIRRIRRQEPYLGARCFDLLQHPGVFMTRQVIHYQDVPWPKCGGQQPFHISFEYPSVGRSVGDHRGTTATPIDGMDQRCGFPVAMRNTVGHPLLTRPPAIAASHVGFRTCLVKKYQLGDIQPTLLAPPAYPTLLNVRSILLAGTERLFLCECPWRRSSSQIVFKQQSKRNLVRSCSSVRLGFSLMSWPSRSH